MTVETWVHWVLRLGAAACFIGHGAFGIITKPEWLPFFALVGIGPDVAYRLMPVIGSLDIALGLAVLLSPRPAVLLYMAAWSVWTAALRPLTGDHVWEMLERAGNYGVPLALLAASEWPRTTRGWFAPLRTRTLTVLGASRLSATLVATVVLLLVGHGALALLHKPLLVKHAALVAGPDAAEFVTWLGAIELVFAATIAAWPAAALASFIALWKGATEMLFLGAGAPAWEVVERGGSYAAPICLAILAARSLVPPLLPRLVPLRLSRVTRVVVVALLVSALGRTLDAQQLSDDSLLVRLRAGGLAIVCRHAATDRSQGGDQPPLRLDDRASQRNITTAGEAQARTIGEAVKAARLPIGRVLSSPMFRTYETATIAFGAATKTDSLMPADKSPLRAMISVRPPAGKNDVFVTHNGLLVPTFSSTKAGSLAEGDCVVVEPLGDSFDVLRKLSPAQWTRLAELKP